MRLPPAAATPDVAIVGGGVAGSSLALTLRRAGLDVHLIERSEHFRDRIRGETIHPWGVTHLRALGLYDEVVTGASAQEQRSWQKYVEREAQPPYRWADDFPDIPNGLGVGHVALQHTLLAAAFAAGTVLHRPATVTFARVDALPQLDVTSSAGVQLLRPRLVVGADGELSATRAWLGGGLAPDPTHHALGGVLIRGLGLAPDRIHQAFFEGGFFLASPLAGDLTRVYLVIDTTTAKSIQRAPDPAGVFVDRFRASMPVGLLGAAWEQAGPAGFFPNATAVASIPPSRDVVLVGDASGRNDPSQGHGLSLVFRDVRELRDLLTSGLPWPEVPDAFHRRKAAEFEVLRQHAHWNERTATETGPEIDALKARIARARELDPTAGGFAAIFATGPAGLEASEAARRHYFGEDLDPNLAAAG